jgi:16S rRNA G966 N2-methylase RsmD
MKKYLAVITLLICSFPSYLLARTKKDKQEYYQVTIYHFKDAVQKQELDTYLETAYLPALHRMGINNVGVFTPIANDTAIDKRIFIIMPGKSLEQLTDLPGKLLKDDTYQLAAKKYMDAVYTDPPFKRMEKIIAKAFSKAPVLTLPALSGSKAERVYEFRSYESPTEKLYRNKVQMFNEGGEVTLFKRLNFNAVFYADVVAGSNMPNLIYMTSFENMADRDAHWKTFSADPEWKKLSTDPIYQHNVSKAEVILMKAASYSDY